MKVEGPMEESWFLIADIGMTNIAIRRSALYPLPATQKGKGYCVHCTQIADACCVPLYSIIHLMCHSSAFGT